MKHLKFGLGFYKSVSNISPIATYLASVQAAGGTISAQNITALENFYVSVSSYREKIIRFCCWPTTGIAGSMIPLIKTLGPDVDVNHGFVNGDFNINGLTGDGVGKYIDTGFDPFVLGLNTDEFGLHVYLTNTFSYTDSACPLGSYGAIGDRADTFLSSGQIGGIMGSVAAGQRGTNLDIGLFSIIGIGSDEMQLFKDGQPIYIPAAAPQWAFNTGNLSVFALNLLGTPSRFASAIMGGYVLTNNLSVSETASFFDAMHTLMLSMGRVSS
jgi:hypothetical protein